MVAVVKNINIPLTDEQWKTLKELATLNRLNNRAPASITQLILESLRDVMPSHQLQLAAMKGIRRE